MQTEEALPSPKEAMSLPSSADSSVYLQTPLHMAIAYNHPDVVSVILEQKGRNLGVLVPKRWELLPITVTSELCH